MVEDLIKYSENNVLVIPGSISFPVYEELINQAKGVAEYVSSIEVNEENIKEAKKLLANVNKSIKVLEDRRITIKKEMLMPYESFEKKIKEIVGIVKEADTIVRQQVKELEEIERIKKQNEIKEIWNKRIGLYEFNDLMQFVDFLKPEHLNKTTSLKNIEEEMVDWMENTQKDLSVLNTMEDGDKLTLLYLESRSISTAIEKLNQQRESLRKINEVNKEIGISDTKYIFVITNKKDAKLAEMLLKENKIDYKLTIN